MDTVLGNVLVNVLQVTSWLEVSSVGVEVIMCHSLLDAHTKAHTFLGEGVNGIHKLSIIRRQSVCGRHAFKQWPCWIETWADGIFNQEPFFVTKHRISGFIIQRILLQIRFDLASKFRKHNYYPNPAVKLTGNSSDLLRTFQVASSKSRDVSAKAVANQMNLSDWILVVYLLRFST